MSTNTMRHAMKATTRAEQQLAKRIAALPPDSDERIELEAEIANAWVFDLIETLEDQVPQEEPTP